jgi:hypothetical protein
VDDILTIDEIRALLDHYPGQFHELGILGGEPFLYPHLGEVLELLWSRNITAKVFTSATNPAPEALNSIEFGKNPVYFVVNIGTRDTYTDEKYRNLTDFMSRFNRITSLSYTIFDTEADFSFLFDTIDEYHLLMRFIRVGLALPIYRGGNRFISSDRFAEMGKYFVRMAETAAERSVSLGMDCGFTACMFTTREIGVLQRSGVNMAFDCCPVVDIGPGLEAWNCFPLFRLHRENALGTDNLRELYRSFDKHIGDYFGHRAGIFPQCADCKHYRRRACRGGCKSYNVV